MSQNICQWIETHADFVPEKLAVRFEGREITYRELLSQITQTAAVLKDVYGIGRGERVAYLGFNSPELLVLLFACARLGALLLPLNWRLAPLEQAYILENAVARILVCDDDHKTIGHQLSDKVPGCVACDHADIATVTDDVHDCVDRDPKVDLMTPVLLVYTSGTTGRPKGAVLTQQAVLFNALNSVHMHDLDISDHILTALPMFHVGGLNIQTTPALYVGATVTLQRRFEPATVLSAIRDLRPTRLVLVPATIMALAEHPDFKRTDFSSIRSVTTGSTIVQKSVIDIFHDRNVPVIQNYGLTETGPVALYLRIDDAFSRVGSTGRGALHTRFRIVDDEDRDVPTGQSGELLLQGSNVLLEYWRDPAATRQALQDGWFRTGDIGYCDSDGYVYINDRKKDVVISGSENIYPAELEHVLDQMEGLIEAAVVGMPDNRWGEVPVAVIVPDSACDIDKAKVLSCFDGVLARFKHPKAIFSIDVLPRNVMGKVLKHELRQMLTDEMSTQADLGAGRKRGKLAQVL